MGRKTREAGGVGSLFRREAGKGRRPSESENRRRGERDAEKLVFLAETEQH